MHGSDRADAIAKMQEALAAFEIEGVPTTIGLHRAIMDDAGFAQGGYTCAVLPENPGLLGD